MKRFLFYITYAFLWVVAWLPLPILYLLSDFTYFIIYYLVRYRVKTTRQNIRRAFPTQTSAEQRKIERDFYHHLCDYGLESIHMMHMSDREMRKHVNFKNTDLLIELGKENKSIIALFGHYCNWEWVSSLPLYTHDSLNISTLYKTLTNPYFDQFFINLRSRFGTYCYPKQRVLRGMSELKSLNKPFVLAFIADQTPSGNGLHFWTNWLNQDTPFFTGWETIAHKINCPVVFLEMRKIKRGYYQFTVEMLCEKPNEQKPFELTEQYARRMEQNILINPAYWLWSHRRWKHHRTN